MAKHCLKLLVAHWYENREGVSEANVKEVPMGIERILDQLRVVNYR